MGCSRRRVGEEKAEKGRGGSGVGVWSKADWGFAYGSLRKNLRPKQGKIATINSKYCYY